jgi:HD superfamily phosphohydrolase
MDSSAQSKLQVQIDAHLEELLTDYKPASDIDGKVIRDTLSGFVQLYPHEVAILDSPLVQRLRYISQTALASYTYPSASHSRFEHSLGCLLMAEKIITAINNKESGLISIPDQYSIRLAALLHDVGHGPFSHASESFYEDYEEIRLLKKETPDFFKEAAAHEILGYFILKSKKIKELLWDKIVEKYEHRFSSLKHVVFDHIPAMVIGKPITPEKTFMSQVINGPFDVDKLDYLQRDGYFSGIQTMLDIDRLLITIGVHQNREDGVSHLYTDVSGVTVLEQVMFNKMILFSSIYHHHKVRAGLIGLNFIFDRIKRSNGDFTIKGLNFDKVVDFLRVDDRDILNGIHSNVELDAIIKKIKNRDLLKRALVICPISLKNERNPAFVSLQNNAEEREDIRQQMCQGDKNKMYDAYVDCPRPPKFLSGPLDAKVKIAKDAFVSLNTLYPVSGWVTGYAQYRYKGYVFAKPGMEQEIGRKAFEILKSKGLELNEKAFILAKNNTGKI